MKLLDLTILASAALSSISALEVDFYHFAQNDCTGGSLIGGVDHLKADEDVKNFDDSEPVFHSLKLKVTEDADDMDTKFCEIIVCTMEDCGGSNRDRVSLGNVKDYSDNRCMNTPRNLGGRAVDFTCRDLSTGTSTFKDASATSTAPTKHTATVTVTEGQGDHHQKAATDKDDNKPTTTVTFTEHRREVTLMPEPARPAHCDECDYWWWRHGSNKERTDEHDH